MWGIVAFLGAALIYPIVLTVAGAFVDDVASFGLTDVKRQGLTLRHLANVFRDPVLVRSLLNSLMVAAATTLLATLIALPLAILAARYALGASGIGDEIVNAGITGESFRGRVEGLTRLGDREAVVTSIEGRAFVTGHHRFVVDERDPLGEGFLLR